MLRYASLSAIYFAVYLSFHSLFLGRNGAFLRGVSLDKEAPV